MKERDHLEDVGIHSKIKECMILVVLKNESVTFVLLNVTESITVLLILKKITNKYTLPGANRIFLYYINTLTCFDPGGAF
jgi:hypothetical protein